MRDDTNFGRVVREGVGGRRISVQESRVGMGLGIRLLVIRVSTIKQVRRTCSEGGGALVAATEA